MELIDRKPRNAGDLKAGMKDAEVRLSRLADAGYRAASTAPEAVSATMPSWSPGNAVAARTMEDELRRNLRLFVDGLRQAAMHADIVADLLDESKVNLRTPWADQ